MHPTSTYDTVRLEQARRLEGFRRWSLRHAGPSGASDPGAERAVPPTSGVAPGRRLGRQAGRRGGLLPHTGR